MRRERHIEVGGHALTVRELTVAEIRAWLADAESQLLRDADGTPDVVGLWLLDECSFGDLLRMSTVTRDQLGDFTPAEIRELVAVCRELNPDFFTLRARLMRIGEQASLPARGTSSSKSPA